MKKEILITGIIFLFIGVGIQPAFAVEITNNRPSSEDIEDCGCEVESEYKQDIVERLIAKLRVYINKIILKVSGVLEVDEEFKELLDAFNSDQPICDLVLQINASIRSKIQDLNDLLIQHRFHPIRGRIYLCYTLILLIINIYIIPLWFLSDCGDWP